MGKLICYGAGLVALDVILNGSQDSPAYLTAGGSCGNVLAILSFLGMEAAPIARLKKDKAAKEILKDLMHWNVNSDYITTNFDGSTPIIIHRILKDKKGKPKHKFEFKNPESGSWLPQYKPVLASFVKELHFPKSANVFYFDRASRGTIDLAEKCKQAGALVFFEPPSITDMRLFQQASAVSHIIKFSSERISNFDKAFPVASTTLEIKTLGSAGLEFRSSQFRDPSRWEKMNSLPIDQSLVVDSAGAGDWCSAGIIQTLLSFKVRSFSSFTKAQIVQALNTGQSYSAINVCFIGARGAMYNLKKSSFAKLSDSVAKHDFEPLKKAAATGLSNIKSWKHLKISALYS